MAAAIKHDGQKVVMIGAIGSKQTSTPCAYLGYFDVAVHSSGAYDLSSSDYDLVRADILSASGAQLGIAKSSVERSFTPPVYKNSLGQNYPNPFNPTTTILFSLEKAGQTELRIYDVRGGLVKTLLDGKADKGNQRVAWTGDNNIGNPVASGVYFYRLTSRDFRATKKMVLLR
jgi:FlgD Ig-like domain